MSLHWEGKAFTNTNKKKKKKTEIMATPKFGDKMNCFMDSKQLFGC